MHLYEDIMSYNHFDLGEEHFSHSQPDTTTDNLVDSGERRDENMK